MVDFSRPVLALDTSTSFLSLALWVDGQMSTFHQAVGNQQSTLILPTLARLLDEAHIACRDIATIVYAQGPGAFTGLRIGLGVAQGLALAQNLPLIGIPCLPAVASLATPQHCVLAATDARMGEVFYAWFDTKQQRRLSADLVGKAADIVLPDNVNEAVGVGNAYEVYAEVLPVRGHAMMPTAADYLNLALTGRYHSSEADDAHLHYVRNKVALTASEQAARR